ncbi:MAG: hypothetical protein ABEI86_00490, partial [Halobacteriaceae archaeon]
MYTVDYSPKNEIEKIMRRWAIHLLTQRGIQKTSNIPKYKINYQAVINTFDQYTIQEQAAYPFSLTYFTPATYLFTRHFTSPVHEFNLFVIRWLIDKVREDHSWPHVNDDQPYSFCTALSLLTLSW